MNTVLCRCPKCKSQNSAEAWNASTRRMYDDDITEIQEDGSEDAEFVCPSCGEESGGLDIATFVERLEAIETTESAQAVKRPEVTNRIIALMDAQNAKGLAKYGTTIDEAQDKDYDWQLMMIEELLDALQYQQKENMRLERLLNPKEE